MKKDVDKNPFEKDSIDLLLSKQKEFCARFMPIQEFRPEPTSLTKDSQKDPRVIWSLDAVVCFLQETAELRNTMPWKHWKDYSDWKPLIPAIHEEIVDQLHFVINIAVVLGLEAREIGEVGFYFEEQKKWLSKTGVNLAKLGTSTQVTSKNSSDDPRVKLTLFTITELEMALNDFRDLFPWNINKDYFNWNPDYSRYKKEYKKIFGFFIKECVIWGLDEDLLVQKYLEKHDINIQRQKNGYAWGPSRKKL